MPIDVCQNCVIECISYSFLQEILLLSQCTVVEQELRKWAIDTGVVKYHDRVSRDDFVNNEPDIADDSEEQEVEEDAYPGSDIVSRIIDQSNAIQSTAKYDSITSVSVASCTTTVGCLSRLWDEIVQMIENIPEDDAKKI